MPKEFKNATDCTESNKSQLSSYIIGSREPHTNEFLTILIEHKAIAPEMKKRIVQKIWNLDDPKIYKTLASVFQESASVIPDQISQGFKSLAENKTELLINLINKTSPYTVILKELFQLKSQSGGFKPELEQKLSLKKIIAELKSLIAKIDEEKLTNKELKEIKDLDLEMIIKWIGNEEGVEKKIKSYNQIG